MTTMDNAERAERRARQRELADRLKASGALDGIFEQIDAGVVPLGGDDGLLKGMLKAALERGLEVELTDHVGYERGDPEASLFSNSRNGTTPKMVSSEIGDVDLAVPRDRNGTFTPQLVPKGSRRLGGLDEMIISLYAGIHRQHDLIDAGQPPLPLGHDHRARSCPVRSRGGLTAA